MNEEQRAQYLADVQQKIDACGWCVQGVFDPDGDLAHCWVYTVGLSPEYVMTGMNPMQGAEVLNAVVSKLIENYPLGPPARTKLSGYLIDYEIMLTPVVNDADRWLRVARDWRIWRKASVLHAMQVLWPDVAHRMPYEKQYDKQAFPQPVLA